MTQPSTAERVHPHDLDTEGALLGAVLWDPSTLALVSWLRPDEFFSEANRRIWEAALWLSEQGMSADAVSVAGRLRDIDRLQQVGGAEYLAGLADLTPAVSDAEAYAGRLRDLAHRRSLIRACHSTEARAYDCKIPTSELTSEHEQAIYELNRDDRSRQAVDLGPLLNEVFEQIVESAKSGRSIVGTPTGFDRLDRLTAGLHPNELTVLAARPGMGKTSLALNIARNVAMMPDEDGELRNGVVVFSLEMPREQLAQRWVCGEARVFSSKIRMPGELMPSDWSSLTEATKALFALPILIDDTPAIGLIEMAGKCRRAGARWESTGARLALVVVDYIQLAHGDDSGNREQEISSLSRGLKSMSKQLRVPVIALSQLNRAVETRGTKDKRPQLSDLRESGAIEQDADNIIFIYRDDYYDKNSQKKGLAELIVAKQRNGPTGIATVRFNSAYTRFDNLAKGEGPEDQQEAG